MTITKEQVSQWCNEWFLGKHLEGETMPHHIAQRAAAHGDAERERELMSMGDLEPVDDVRIHDGHEYLYVRACDNYYTATQLAAARLQGAEDERKKVDMLEAECRSYDKRITELEQQLAEKREPLTDEQIDKLQETFTLHDTQERSWYGENYQQSCNDKYGARKFARAIESAHGIGEQDTQAPKYNARAIRALKTNRND